MGKKFITEIYLNIEEKGYLGRGRVELLKLIDKYGSILKAAKELGMSYKAAWDMVDAINNLSPQPVVVSISKGKRGGQSILTEYGKKLVENYEKVEQFMKMVSDYLSSNIDDVEKAFREFRRLNLGLSARNKILVKVEKVNSDRVNANIYAKLGKQTVSAIITTEAYLELEIKEGDEVYFIFKASDVLLSKSEITLTSANILKGRVKDIICGDINCEVKVDVGGATITTVITKDATSELDLKEGNQIYLLIKPADIIVGKV